MISTKNYESTTAGGQKLSLPYSFKLLLAFEFGGHKNLSGGGRELIPIKGISTDPSEIPFSRMAC